MRLEETRTSELCSAGPGSNMDSNRNESPSGAALLSPVSSVTEEPQSA